MDSNVTASEVKHRRTTLGRIEKYISDTFFTDVNLYGKLYSDRKPLDSLKHWRLPGGEGAWEKWNVELVLQEKDNFTPVKVGQSFGPSWTTHWFLTTFTIPYQWKNREVCIRWKSQSEAMIWSLEGHPLQGLSSGTNHQMRTDFRISKSFDPNTEKETQSYLIEMACSRMLGIGKGGMINPPNMEETFTLEMAELCAVNSEVYSLLLDLRVLHDLAKHLPDDQRGYRALYAGNQMINYIIADSLSQAKEVSKTFFSKSNGASALTLALIGNCHIDSAWLWPYSETKRKCARSWSSTIALMEDYPEMVFACSQAQQLQWVKNIYPHLFSKIKEKSKDGKFIHVGATWVEMDGLIPSGESFMRQFLYGQKFFQEEFGSECDIFWLPDTFGYSSQIPQICKHFGISFFLTQKLSWSLVNKFPHHTFLWEGIDGTQILAHFPPGDSYEMNVRVEEALKSEKNLMDKGRVSIAGFLYGYGDGGGGPTKDMLEMARRISDVDGCPRMKHMTPGAMFRRMAEEERNLCRWVGELYLELHNGTYTSQAQTKQHNRRCEFLLREAEILLSMYAFQMTPSDGGKSFDEICRMRSECEEAWKKVLLNQFHDVLPGSSIGKVYRDSDALYQEVIQTAENIRTTCSLALNPTNPTTTVFNFLPWTVSQVIEIETEDAQKVDSSLVQVSPSEGGSKNYLAVEAPGFSSGDLDFKSPEITAALSPRARVLRPPRVLVERIGTSFRLENRYVSALFTKYGELVELVDKERDSRNIFERVKDPQSSGKGNLITLYDDIPLIWDAWDVMDYHVETRRVLNEEQNKENIGFLQEVQTGPLRAELHFSLSISSKSSLRQKIILTAVDPFIIFENEVEWIESHKFLKVEFETGVLARNASYDIQFGHVQRPTHQNTSWDSAKFEVCGHKWANICEFDRGLSVLSDCKYGWSAQGGTLVLSLLRSPKAPDDMCDMGHHTFKYAVLPHKSSLQDSGTIEAAYKFNSPLLVQKFGAFGCTEWLRLSEEGVMVEAVKVAENSTSAMVVRLYEMYGRTLNVDFYMQFDPRGVYKCDGMERAVESLPVASLSYGSSSFVNLRFGPFEIQTIRIIFK